MPVKATVQSADQLWNISYNSELRWFSWQNTRGFTTDVAPLSGKGHGSQLYTPMSLSMIGNPILIGNSNSCCVEALSQRRKPPPASAAPSIPRRIPRP